MPNTHLILVSSQPIPNLIPILAGDVARVHLLVSAGMKQQGERLVAFLEARSIICTTHSIEPYNLTDVEAVCHKIVDSEAPDSILLNSTGGTKISAFGAFSAFRSRGLPIIYFDPQRWSILRLDRSDILPKPATVELSVADYLAVHGMSVIEDAGEDEALLRRRNLSDWLAKNLAPSSFIRVLNGFSAEAQKSRTFPVTLQFDNRYDVSFSPYLSRLAKETTIGWDQKKRSITFPNLDSARYLGGFWLEEYVYSVATTLGVHDVRRNVRVAWGGVGGKPITNEFDVVFTSRCRLFLVSCKTSKLASEAQYRDKNPLYELDSLKDDAAGLYGQGVLVSATPLGVELQKRAETQNIVTVSAEQLQWLKTKLMVALNFKGITT